MDALERARATGLMAEVEPASAVGYAGLGLLRVAGPDALSFLQSQTTNDLEALAPGQAHVNARVTRTGHLVAVFSVHRVPATEGHAYLLLLPHEDLRRLHEDLDAFLFADQVQIEDVTPTSALVATGPATAAGPDTATVVEASGGLLRHAFTGDPALIAWGDRVSNLRRELGAADVAEVGADTLGQVVEVLRIEAGMVRPAVDLGKKRLLPETGLEQLTVSYTKGCYIGQEVIARVRTYGSVPRALRAVVLEGEGLDGLPGVGEPIVLDDGARAGDASARTLSPAAGGPVLLAFLGRNHRTPGQKLTLRTPAGLRDAQVALLPLHRAADREGRVQQLYDLAIKTFATGDEDGALVHLDHALRLDPEFADGYEAIGVILGRSGRFHEAIDFFRRLEEVAPAEPLVNTNLSLYYMKLGDKGTAEAESAKAARKSMARERGEAGGTAAEIAREQDEARQADAARKERMFRQVLDFDPDDPIAWYGLGRSLSTLQRWDEAADALERATTVDGKNAAAFLAWGKALERLGADERAVDVYRQGMEVASRRGDLMPLKEMQSRVLLLSAES